MKKLMVLTVAVLLLCASCAKSEASTSVAPSVSPSPAPSVDKIEEASTSSPASSEPEHNDEEVTTPPPAVSKPADEKSSSSVASSSAPSAPAPEETPVPAVIKSNEEIAAEVIAGKWDPDRKTRLEAAGYDYTVVQAIVNQLLAPPASSPAPNPVTTPDKSAQPAPAPEIVISTPAPANEINWLNREVFEVIKAYAESKGFAFEGGGTWIWKTYDEGYTAYTKRVYQQGSDDGYAWISFTRDDVSFPGHWYYQSWSTTARQIWDDGNVYSLEEMYAVIDEHIERCKGT